MQTVFLLLLFILQVIGFYFMALLYMKVSKFNNLEKKQQKLMMEMDDAIGAYLSELKEENERLILIIEKHHDEKRKDISPESQTETARDPLIEKSKISIKTPGYPVKAAMKSYQTAPVVSRDGLPLQNTLDSDLDERTLAIRMYEDGKPVEEIAKRLGKGKTEVELLLKFR